MFPHGLFVNYFYTTSLRKTESVKKHVIINCGVG